MSTSTPRVQVPPASPGMSRTSRADLALLLVAFATLRLLTVLFFKPGGEVYAGGYDYRFYWQMAELSLDGHYPYLDYWLEYPPLFPWALVAIYKLALLLPAWPSPILWFQIGVGAFLLCFDVANLKLVYALARRLHDPHLALRAGWLYAGLFFPLYVLTNWFDSFALFFLLLALWATLAGRPVLAGLALGGGFMAKVIPAVVGPVALLATGSSRARTRLLLAGAVAVAALAAPFALLNREMLVASFSAMLSRSSWLTPWALLEGYFDVGYMPPWPVRFDPVQAGWQMHPPTLPWLAINAAFVLCLLTLVSRRVPWHEPRVMVAAAAISLHLFFLFNKGWSPAFLLYVLALLVVLKPDGWGLGYATLLTFNNFVEWPLAGVYFREEHWLLWAVVLMRSGLLLLLSWEYALSLYPRLAPRWRAMRRAALGPALAALAVGALLGGWTLLDRYWAAGPHQPVVAYVRALAVPGQVLVASSREAFYALKPHFPGDRFASPRDDLWVDERSVAAALREATQGATTAWVVFDHANGEARRRELVAAWFDHWGSRASDAWFGTYHLVGYVANEIEAGAEWLAAGAVFDGQLRLEAWQGPAVLARGRPARFLTRWQILAPAKADYKVFLHLVDETGRLLAQRDRPLSAKGDGPSRWRAGTTTVEAFDIVVPAGAPAGRYRLLVGLYDPATGARLAVWRGLSQAGDSVALGDWLLPAEGP